MIRLNWLGYDLEFNPVYDVVLDREISSKSRRNKTRRRLKLRALIEYIKNSVPCQDCGTFVNLTFHHLDKKQKFKDINEILRDNNSFNLLIKEIQKCTMLCRDCHDKVHIRESINNNSNLD